MPVAGSLAYEITLKTDDFIKNIAKATAAFFALKFSFKQFAEPFEEGFRLRNLSKQTNESISSLFKFEWGLKAVGISSEEAGTLLTRFQKALGAVNAQGVPLQKTFAMMGLNIQNLRRMSTADAFDLWAAKLKNLNKTSAAFAATALAGGLSSQTGAGSAFLRIARSIDDFREAMRRANAQAKIFEQFGYTFYQIIRRITLIRDTLKGFFVGLAGGAGGGILYLLRQIDDFMARNSQRIVDLGKKIGMVFSVIAEALKEGKIFETIKLGLFAAIESAANFAIQTLVGLTAFLTTALIGAFNISIEKFGQQFVDVTLKAVKVIVDFMGDFVKRGMLLGSLARGDLFQTAAEHAFAAMIPGNTNVMGDAIKAFQEAFKNAKGFFGTSNQKAFENAVQKLWAAASKMYETEKGPPGPNAGQILGGIFKLPITALEKMGFTFRGGLLGTPGSDYAKLTAQNTAHMVNLLTNTNALLGGSLGSSALGATHSFTP